MKIFTCSTQRLKLRRKTCFCFSLSLFASCVLKALPCVCYARSRQNRYSLDWRRQLKTPSTTRQDSVSTEQTLTIVRTLAPPRLLCQPLDLLKDAPPLCLAPSLAAIQQLLLGCQSSASLLFSAYNHSRQRLFQDTPIQRISIFQAEKRPCHSFITHLRSPIPSKKRILSCFIIFQRVMVRLPP